MNLRNVLECIMCVSVLMPLSCSWQKQASIAPNYLRCEYRVDPLGIDVKQPRLSWMINSIDRDARQTAWQIMVASSLDKLNSDEADLWDSGKVMSDETAQIVYDGTPLTSRMQCWWKVRSWDSDDKSSIWSVPAFWSMGLLDKGDWKAEWIGRKLEGDPAKAPELAPGPPAPYIRKEFTVDKPVKRATVYVTARGLFELHLNGEKVSEDVFAPEWTDYDRRIQYRTYDVTDMIQQGANAAGAMLGDGWYAGYIGWRKTRGHYGFQTSLLLQMEVEYTDGSVATILSNGDWRTSEGPIRASDLMRGEDYDARYEMTGWDSPGFDESAWEPVVVVPKPDVPLVWQPSEPVQVTEYVPSKEITEPAPGVYVFNLGQNIAGWARLMVKGPSGTKVTLRFAERLNPDGTIYTENLRSARATDTYILKGGGVEIFEPHFTFHGFQYVEVTGFTGEFSTEAVTGVVVHNNMQPSSTFTSSSDMVNKLWSNARWGMRGNYISVPTDCPQRDERLGWMGDAQIFIRTGTYFMDVAGFFTKWMRDVADAQSDAGAFADTSPRLKGLSNFEAVAAWADAGLIVPWTMYRVYDDTRMIDEYWADMEEWMAFIMNGNPNYLRLNNLNNNYGDWLSTIPDEGFGGTSVRKNMLATAFWAYDAMLMKKMAEVTGRSADVAKYDELYRNIRKAYQDAYILEDGHLKDEGQTSYVLALLFGLMPDDLREKAAGYLVNDIHARDDHLTTGFVGAVHLNPILSDMGYDDVAYTLLLNETYPSWGYSIRQGATTIWERWDGWTQEKGFQNPGMNSFNHYSFGAINEWVYRYVTGIELDPEVPAFKRFIIHPHLDKRMPEAEAEFLSMYGRIYSGWEQKDGKLTMNVEIPPNTTAMVYIPSAKDAEVTESGKSAEKAEGVSFLRAEEGHNVYEVGSGIYNFESTLP